MDQMRPQVSVVIPTKNAGPAFRQTLEMIFRQRVSYPFEVLVVDSGSQDDTVSICRQFPVKILNIPPKDFNHGATRNYTISRAQGEFIVLTVQDAVPYDDLWMDALISAILRDDQVAGAYSRHLPRPGVSCFTRRIIERWTGREERIIQQIQDRDSFRDLPMEKKQAICTFNNVSSALRRSVWEQHPFPPLSYAEDLAWGLEVLEAGWRIVYEPDSRVFHSHERAPWYEFKRAYVDGKTVAEIFSAPPKRATTAEIWSLVRLLLGAYRDYFLYRAKRILGVRPSEFPEKEMNECIDAREWYRANFDRDALSRIFGRLSSLSEGQVINLLGFLDSSSTPLSSPKPGKISTRIRNELEGAEPGVTRLDQEIIFETLWSEFGKFGKGIIKRAVLEGSAPSSSSIGLLPEAKKMISELAGDLFQSCQEAAQLFSYLFWRIRLQTTALVVGKQLGLAYYSWRLEPKGKSNFILSLINAVASKGV